MSDQGPAPEPRDETLDVARALYAALMEARPYVVEHAQYDTGVLLETRAARASELLERVDGALADAGELLQGVTA